MAEVRLEYFSKGKGYPFFNSANFSRAVGLSFDLGYGLLGLFDNDQFPIIEIVFKLLLLGCSLVDFECVEYVYEVVRLHLLFNFHKEVELPTDHTVLCLVIL